VSLIAGAGFLYTTEVEYADLGVHLGRRLRGRVERRRLRLALGRSAGIRLHAGRLRPVAVEVTEAGRRYEIPVVAPPDPRLAAARRVVLCWLLAGLVFAAARRIRAKEPPQ